MAKFVKVAAQADIPVGGKKLVEIDGVAVAVFNVNGSFYAIEDLSLIHISEPTSTY